MTEVKYVSRNEKAGSSAAAYGIMGAIISSAVGYGGELILGTLAPNVQVPGLAFGILGCCCPPLVGGIIGGVIGGVRGYKMGDSVETMGDPPSYNGESQ